MSANHALSPEKQEVADDLLKRLEGLSTAAPAEVLAFVRVLQRKPETLTPKEISEVDEGRREVLEGQWTRWREIKRTEATCG